MSALGFTSGAVAVQRSKWSSRNLAVRSRRDVVVAASELSLPDSMEDSMKRARDAYEAAGKQGYRRMTIEVDLTGGDETYTVLKNTFPLVKTFAEVTFKDNAKGLRFVFPDMGAAALAARDWQNLSNATFVGFERVKAADEDTVVLLVSPRASEVETLTNFVNVVSPLFKQSARPFILFNPDLIDMGVTGIGLTARKLREEVLNTFETVFYLKTLSWGAIYRCYPSGWTVWQDDPNVEGGFRLLDTVMKKPDAEELDKILQKANPDKSNTASGGFFASLKRFLNVYSKG
eukprot:Plantae.Rhodophyta-Purpureofilum_apyrenoidigerum.ctg8219.p1 GENE.Plantae.Rhodophyta-Purpureofilum_apyrenoidigerum.ctg8219~~Plantae.Rhodophyta-Purpureofilum_apyrenoidigerum.ctg8219.p1  ORF type:complete len:296 (-),score=40.49 Plantae.Rhodophyta-Purpureofilum_apyrenoidigerum.ctg8219:859-1725(-)